MAAAKDADRSVHQHIETLVAEAHRLYALDNLSEADRKRLHAARVRPKGTVENYEG